MAENESPPSAPAPGGPAEPEAKPAPPAAQTPEAAKEPEAPPAKPGTAGQAGSGTAPQTPAAGGPLTDDEKLWGMLAHVLALTMYVAPLVGNLAGPAVAYFARKDQSKFVRFHAIQSFVLQLALLAVAIGLSIPTILLLFVTRGFLIYDLWRFFALAGVAVAVYVVLMGLKAKNGEFCKYPIVGDWAYKKVYEQDWKPV